MGFGVNNFNNKPVIREAQSMQNDGGSGNLGYFEQGEDEKNKEKHPTSVFPETKGELTDSFSHEGDENLGDEEEFSVAKLIAQIILWFKDLFRKA
jgi:hypothetical protein